jgi:predicted nucleic acid-binding protein
VDAFDSDGLIYAAIDGHPLGVRVRNVVLNEDRAAHLGSILLVSELLTKPTRDGRHRELHDLEYLLGRLTLYPVDHRTIPSAVELGAQYGLKTVDAVHLATAVLAGADRFITNNRRDFTKEIDEIDIVYPDELPG